MRKFVADTETASLAGPVVDFAAVEIDDELNIIGSFESLIDPQCDIAPAAQAIHGISQGMVADAPTMAEYLHGWGNPFGGGEPIIIFGHNVKFDVRMLTLEPRMLPQEFTQACTLRMSRNLWPDLDPARENHQLGTLAVMFGLERGPAHRAMGDVITCLSLLRHITDVSKVSSFEELVNLGTRTLSLETYINFGKHGPNGTDKAEEKGTKLKDLPKSYVNWLLSQKDMDPDLLAALKQRQ